MHREAKVLIVDDNSSVRRIVKDSLEEDCRFSISEARRLSDAYFLLRSKIFDLVILDIRLPDGEGFELLSDKDIRKRHKRMKFLMLSQKSDVETKVGAFRKGAIDYLTKPFSTEELKIRVLKALGYDPSGEDLTHGNLTLNTKDLFITYGGIKIMLTKSEVKLLETILIRKKATVKILSKELFDSTKDKDLCNTRVYISRLNSKFKEITNLKFIKSKYSEGYYIAVK
jgi:DNA-binding response OmpR family regulator